MMLSLLISKVVTCYQGIVAQELGEWRCVCGCGLSILEISNVVVVCVCSKNFQDDCQDRAALELSEWRCLVIAFLGTQLTRLQDLRLTDNVGLFIHQSQFILIIILITSDLNCTNTCCDQNCIHNPPILSNQLSIGNPTPPPSSFPKLRVPNHGNHYLMLKTHVQDFFMTTISITQR